MRPKVVIVGGGFAGLNCAKALDGQAVDVLVVDRHNFHTFQPLLYQVATAGLNAADVAYPIRGILRRQRNVSFRHGEVVGLEDDQILFADGPPERFDHLVIAVGSAANYFGVEGAVEHAFPLYSLADATRLRNHILRMFEHADAVPEESDGALTFVVVGGGPTGVEVAGALVELFDTVLRKDYRHARADEAKVVLVEMLDSVLPPFAASSRRHATEALTERGVRLRLGDQVQQVGPRSVRFAAGDDLPARTVVWAAGVRANPLVDLLPFERGRSGRIVVGPDLRVPGRSSVFVVGDVAAQGDEPHPQLAQVAIQQGKHAASQILRSIDGRRPRPFRYRDPGIMATIGRRSAVAEIRGGLKLFGTLGWIAWLFMHLVWLIGFRNKLSVLVNWAWSYLAWERGPRLILEPEPREAASGRLPNDEDRPRR